MRNKKGKLDLNTKTISYILLFGGLLGMFLSSKLNVFLPFLNTSLVLIPSLMMFGVGLILFLSQNKSSSSKGKEVPIYKDKEIIGYRIVD